jgi:hypothetical protein
VDHRNDQPTEVAIEQCLQLGFRIGSPYRNVLLLHLTKQAINPPLQLPLKLNAINDDDDCCILESLFVLKNQSCRCQQCEGLARSLCMPNESSLRVVIKASSNDGIDRSSLMLP